MRYWRAFGASSLIVLSGAALSAAACSASNNPGGGFGGDGGGASTNHGGSNVIDGSGGSLASNFPAGGTGGDGSGGGKGCATSKNIAKQKPLDMFIMLDQSSSMNTDGKWSSVTSAIANFVAQPEAAGLGVGLGYFPVKGNGPTCHLQCSAQNPCGSGCGACMLGICTGFGTTDSCDIPTYAMPVVEIATLPGANNAQVTAISSSITGHSPDGDGTPTRVGLAGAILHAQDWATHHPDHLVIAVLATDGDPNECDSTVASVQAVAAKGLMPDPPAKPVVTFVIGVGNLQANLDMIAASGGSHMSYLVTPGGNATQEFLDALNAIRGASLSCSYPIPMPNGQTPNFKKLNVEYHPGGGGAEQTIPNVDDLAHCPATGDAWYYDNNANPTEIEMCPSTCSKLTADTMGEVDIVLGCDTIQVPK